jgi:DNA-binding transcriptional LysR family regulator
MTDPVETAEFLAFSKTIDAKSLSRAAAELGVPRATISRRLARLEGRLGVRLIRRTTRSLVLTDAGEALYRHARIVLDAVHDAEASVRRTDAVVRGDLRVSVPPTLSDSFSTFIFYFALKFPEVHLHVHFSSAHVDLRRDGYDAAIRASVELEPGLVARTLARAPLIAVASPAYLAQSKPLVTTRDLQHHRCLMGFARGELPQSHWPLAKGGKLHVDGAFFSNEPSLLVEGALRGIGVALVPLMLVRAFLERGALVRVLPGELEAGSRVSIVYPEREFLTPQLRAFVDAVVAWAPEAIGKGIPSGCAEHAIKRLRGEGHPGGSTGNQSPGAPPPAAPRGPKPGATRKPAAGRAKGRSVATVPPGYSDE